MKDEAVELGCLSLFWLFAVIAFLVKIAVTAGVIYLLYLAIKYLGGF